MQLWRGQLSRVDRSWGGSTQTASCHLGTVRHPRCQLTSCSSRRTQGITATSICRVGLGRQSICNSVLRSDLEGGKDVMLGSLGMERWKCSPPLRCGGRVLCKSYPGSCSSAAAIVPLRWRRSNGLRRVSPGASSPVVMGAAASLTRSLSPSTRE
jgi:hypothetical protein